MRLQDSYMGKYTPFEGDLTLWLRSLPSGASVKNATITLKPTLYNGTIDLTQATPILGVTIVSGTSGPSKGPFTNLVEVNFHARRTLVSVTGSAGSTANPSTLQVDMGGIYVAIANDGTILAPPKIPFQVDFSSKDNLPGLTVNKFSLSQSNLTSTDTPQSVTRVTISSIPTNVNVRLGQLPPFWVQTGEVATLITSPDFSKVLNALLTTLQPQNGFYAIPFVIHSDTIACMDVTVEIDYVLDQAALSPHLPEINLPYTFNRLPDVDTSLSSVSQPSVSLPEGAVAVAGACSAQINGKFQPTRVALDKADDQLGEANVLISPMSSLAQQLPSGTEIAVTGIDLPLFNMTTDFAGLNVAIRDDDDGKPSGNVLASTAVTIGKPLPDHSVWGSATLPKPFRTTADKKYWLVLQSQAGQAYWKAAQATASGVGNPPMQSSSDNGFSWRAASSDQAISPLSAQFRLRETPDRFSIPVQLQIGQGSSATLRSLDEFAPLGKVQLNFDFADKLNTYLTASAKASPPPCGTQDLVVNGNFANPPSDDASIRLFGVERKVIGSARSYGFQSLSFPSQKVDLSVEHFITLTYVLNEETGPPVKIDCAGAVPSQTTLDEIVAAINRKMTQSVRANHNKGDFFFTLTPQQGATEVLLFPWFSNVVPTGWQSVSGQVTRFRLPMEEGIGPIVVELADTSGVATGAQFADMSRAPLLLQSGVSSTSSSSGGDISLTQRLPVSAGCAYQLGVRYLDVLSPESGQTDLASWELAWLDAQGNTLSSENGTFLALSDTTGSGATSITPSTVLYVDTLLVAPLNAVNADLTFVNAGPDVNVLLLEQVSFVPTTQSISNGDFLQWQDTSNNAPPAGWTLQSGTVSLDPASMKPILQGSATEDTVLTQNVNVVAGASYTLQALAQPNITKQANDTQQPVIQQHARVELQWSGGASPGAIVGLTLDGQNFAERDWAGMAPAGVTQAVLRLIQPESSNGASLLVESVALKRINFAPVPLTFLSETPGQLAVSNMHVAYDIPEAPMSAGQIVSAPPSGTAVVSMIQPVVSPVSGEGAMHADAQSSAEHTNVRMLLKTVARESSTLRLLRDNPQLIQQRFGLSDDELNALQSADLLRAGELPTKPGEEEIQTSGEQEVEGWEISGTGTIVPPTYILGLDVSHHNGMIDWAAVADQKYVFAFAKATEGTSFKDAQFANNWAGMKANNILRGAYHFFRANLDATRQANHFLTVMPALQPGDLPPVLDLETTDGVSGTAILDAAATWLSLVEKASGRTPIIYTSARFWRENLAKAKDPNRFSAHYPVWVAYYRHVPQPPLPDGWTSWTFWQYTDSGKVAGIPVDKGKADLDRFYGSLAELRKLAGF